LCTRIVVLLLRFKMTAIGESWFRSGGTDFDCTVSSANASNFRSDNEIFCSDFNVDQKANISE
jgi:hypothetical protein